MTEWLIANAAWVFSGLGTALIGLLAGVQIKKIRQEKRTLTQKGGNFSRNVQIGGDLHVVKEKTRDE